MSSQLSQSAWQIAMHPASPISTCCKRHGQSGPEAGGRGPALLVAFEARGPVSDPLLVQEFEPLQDKAELPGREDASFHDRYIAVPAKSDER